jgi:prepilin-type N-terminal cleavage/methylation domain-containing protein
MTYYKRKACLPVRQGMTLIELLLAIAVTAIVMQGFTYLFVRTWETNRFILEMGLASSMAQRANNKLVTDLRGIQQSDHGAFPIAEATGMSLTIYSDIEDDGVVERVHYYLDLASDELRVGITNPTNTQPVTYPNGDQETRVLARYVVNASNDPIFYYYNDDYPGDTTNNPLTLPTSLANIQLVRIKLYINIQPITAPNNVYIESFVDLRNLHYYEST